MKNLLLVAVCFVMVQAASLPLFAESPAVLTGPSRTELQSTIGGMGLSMGDKLSLRKILQAMQEQGEKVKADGSLSNEQKAAQIVKIRQSALDETKKILTVDQQKQMAALLLPKQ